MMNTIELERVGRLPTADDNAAIATHDLEKGRVIRYQGESFALTHDVLVGHRFAVQTIKSGDAIRSWGRPFGKALRNINPGEYLCNDSVLEELNRRNLGDLPAHPNFVNHFDTYTIDAGQFTPATPLTRYETSPSFMGYRRDGGRGVGTRNTIVLLGTSSLAAGFVRKLEAQLQSHLERYPNVNGVVAVAHTEGGHKTANNRELVLRTLAGFMVHPNVGAVLAVDYGSEAVNNRLLETYLRDHDYPLDHVAHAYMSLGAAFEDDLNAASEQVERWLPVVNDFTRSEESVSELKIALQCGGSDAFSGVSGNPLASWVAREVIRYGGSANLAETDELIGAEAYVLEKVRDLDTAQKFLSFVERFKERVGYHGHSAEGNPSGGNKFRGLYNIYLKSLGAAVKRHPDVPLDFVIDYGEPMQTGGFYFMDSPGNDLESIAGQVAAGCNMIFFVTGNGSITNFPFVPTIKIVTTTDRYNLLENEMDVNAGAYLDGTPMDDLGAQTLDLTRQVASGQLSVGEQAHHAQVQIWRDWQQTRPINVTEIQTRSFDGMPIPIPAIDKIPGVTIPVYGQGTEQVGLILPTSLCSGQIARQCVDRLNDELAGQGVSRFVTLVHTEGCGASITDEYNTTQLGYLKHPNVRHALLLEHGCEATHNAYFRQMMADADLNPNDFGWASIQLDGGIQTVTGRVVDWFRGQLAGDDTPQSAHAGLEAVKLGILSQHPLAVEDVHALSQLVRQIVSAGGSVVVGEGDALLNGAFADTLQLSKPQPTIRYGQSMPQAGFHIMAAPSVTWTEALTGLAATGANILIGYAEHPMPGHPMIPMLQPSVDVTDAPLLDRVVAALTRAYIPQSEKHQHIDFQITRGLLGVSL